MASISQATKLPLDRGHLLAYRHSASWRVLFKIIVYILLSFNISFIAVQAELDRANQMWINWIERNKGQTLEGNFPNKKGMRSWPSYETDIASAIQFGDRPSGKFIQCFIISHFLEKILIISLQFKRDLKKRRRPGNPTSIGSSIRQAMGRYFNFCELRS